MKVGDKVIYNDPNDPIGATGIYTINRIKGDKVTIAPWCGMLGTKSIKVNVKDLEQV